MSNDNKNESKVIEVNPPKSMDASFSVFIREDEIVTGEETVFTLRFKTKDKLQAYFNVPNFNKHEFFVRTDTNKPPKTAIIVRIIHPETGQIIVIFGSVTRQGAHPNKPGLVMGLYYKIFDLDKAQTKIIKDFIA